MIVSTAPTPDARRLHLEDLVEIEAAVANESAPGKAKMEDHFVFLAPGMGLPERAGLGYVFGVFDGCGGTAGGGRAANAAADCFRALLRGANSEEPHAKQLKRTLLEANARVCEIQLSSPALSRAACAATVCWLTWDAAADKPLLFVIHVGDSGLWVLGDEQGTPRVRWRTTDHKLGGSLSSVLGMDAAELQIEEKRLWLDEDDTVLLATDGLWKPYPIRLPDLVAGARGPEDIVRSWLAKTRANGSWDDQTAIAIQLG